MNKLTPKERLFCRYYQLTGNYREAAAKAGYSRPEKAGAKLLETKRISRELSEQKIGPPIAEEVFRGLRRIAFGNISDAIKLLFAEELPEDIDSLDLFCISEIKRPKSGGTEIKFFDRIKALEQLASLAESGNSAKAEPFYKILEKSAQNLFESSGGGDYGI